MSVLNNNKAASGGFRGEEYFRKDTLQEEKEQGLYRQMMPGENPLWALVETERILFTVAVYKNKPVEIWEFGGLAGQSSLIENFQNESCVTSGAGSWRSI